MPEKHGFSNDQKDKNRFVATFVAGLHLTKDWDSGTFREVHLIVPINLEMWCIDTMNLIVEGIRQVRAGIPKQERLEGNRLIVKAVTKLVMGNRPYLCPNEPPRWVGFGYTRDSEAPSWLKQGLLSTSE